LFEFNQDTRKIFVAGDLHGDFQSYTAIVNAWEKEAGAFLVFLGDYADRGENGVEILESLATLINDERVVALKGNHEAFLPNRCPPFSPCSLIKEVERKRGSWNNYYEKLLSPLFNQLYTAAILPGKILFLHGGVGNIIKNIDSLKMHSKKIEEQILWSDPVDEIDEKPNPRGAGVCFGPDITDKILARLSVKQIIRSHQPYLAPNYPCYSHSNKVMTISSTDVYGGSPYFLEIENMRKYDTFDQRGYKIQVIEINPVSVVVN
jgi:hypothetical protein